MKRSPGPPWVCRQTWILLCLIPMVCGSQMLENLPSNIDALTVNCGPNPSEPMNLTYVGQIGAMYATKSPFGCVANCTDARGIVFEMLIHPEDYEKCGVVEVRELTYKVMVRVQIEAVLVTVDDLLYFVTCSYANVTDGERNTGVVEKVGMVSGTAKPIYVPQDYGPSLELVLEDLSTNVVYHPTFDQSVRLHIRKTPSDGCPQYDRQMDRCDSIMAEVTSELQCDVLYDEPFAICNSVVRPEYFVKKCTRHLDALTNRVQLADCYDYWKQDYICSLQATYECNCHNKGIHVSWLPSVECENRKSSIFVESCDLISNGEKTPILVQGCGDTDVLPRSWQFFSSGIHSTRTPFFTFRDLQTNVDMINCTVKLCESSEYCEQDCLDLPDSVMIKYLETKTLSTGPLHLYEPVTQETTTVNTSHMQSPETGESLEKSAHMGKFEMCKGVFTPQTFPLFIAVLVLGFVILILLVVIILLIHRMHKDGPKRLAFPGSLHRDTLFHSLSPRSDYSATTEHSPAGPTLQAFSRAVDTSTLNRGESTVGRGATGHGGVDRSQHEISVQICPQMKVPPPPPKFSFPPAKSKHSKGIPPPPPIN